MMLRMVQNHVIRALRSTECMKHVKKIPIILTQHRFCSSNPTNNIEEWINSFDKPHQSRLQFIQNEVNDQNKHNVTEVKNKTKS